MNEEPESWTLKGFLAGFVLVAVVLFCFVLIMIAFAALVDVAK